MTKTNSDLLPHFVESNLQGIIIFKKDRNIYANSKAAGILEFSTEEICKFDLDLFYKRINPQDLQNVKHFIELYESDLDFEEKIEYRFKTKSGKFKWFKVLAVSVVYKYEKY